MKRAVIPFACVVCTLVLPSCREDAVVLAHLPPNDPMPTDERCVADECARGTYCEKVGCDAPAGSCVPFPSVCPSDEAPVCGCDGVTYFNDCLRRAAGAGGARDGECAREAMPCRSEMDCPRGALCSLLVGADASECGPEIRGRCWVLPVECPPPVGPDRWQPCEPQPPPPEPPPTGPPPPSICIDTCNAIRTGAPFHRSFRCE